MEDGVTRNNVGGDNISLVHITFIFIVGLTELGGGGCQAGSTRGQVVSAVARPGIGLNSIRLRCWCRRPCMCTVRTLAAAS
jgi:hypothetical protein